VAFLASGSLSHRFAQNGLAPEFAHKIWSPFLEKLDEQVLRMWDQREWKAFCEMLPEYASKGHGEGFMHDTAMLMGSLGWTGYDGGVDMVTPYFGASGTGQLNAIFEVTPQKGAHIPPAQASSAQGYTAVSTRL
jgi:3,4-dihydroxyphenylacetate 2,3-dioxygenase